jgi:hypothetical protein
MHAEFVREPEEKSPLGRPRHEWEDGIRLYLSEIGWEVVDCLCWIFLVPVWHRFSYVQISVQNFIVCICVHFVCCIPNSHSLITSHHFSHFLYI